MTSISLYRSEVIVWKYIKATFFLSSFLSSESILVPRKVRKQLKVIQFKSQNQFIKCVAQNLKKMFFFQLFCDQLSFVSNLGLQTFALILGQNLLMNILQNVDKAENTWVGQKRLWDMGRTGASKNKVWC